MNLTAPLAAALLGLSPSRVQRLAATGKLEGAYHTREDNPRRGEWVIPATAVLAYRRQVLAGRETAGRWRTVPPPLPTAEAGRQLIRDCAPGRELSEAEVEELWREMVGDCREVRQEEGNEGLD